MSLIFERGGKESKSPTTSSTTEHTLYSFPGNYTTSDNPNFDVGGHFTFARESDKNKVVFSICGGDPFNGTPPKNVSKDDLLHSYVITIRDDSNITFQISHQPSAITDPLEVIPNAITLPLNKVIGIRIIGIYEDSLNCRNLFVLMDESNTDHWKVVASFNDRGQYIPLVSQRIKGMLKSGPPYRDFPYGDNNAITDIHCYGSVIAGDTWCRQISSKLLAEHLESAFKLDDSPAVAVITSDTLGVSKEEQEIMKKLETGVLATSIIECVLCGANLGTLLVNNPKPSLCGECWGRIDSNIRKTQSQIQK